MRSFWSDPYLWIHLAGAAAVPITLELCLLGLAIGDPIFPPAIEQILVAIVGIVPIFLMQWQRPFYIFSVLLVAILPEYLTIDQRRILRRFKTVGHQVLTVAVAIALAVVLLQLYRISPLVLEPASQFRQWRGLGLLIASGAFLLSNLFLQVSLSVLRVMLISDAEFAAIEPYATDQIRSNFSIFGLKLRQIVPPLTEAQTLAMATAAAAAPAVSPPPAPVVGTAPATEAPQTAPAAIEAQPSEAVTEISDAAALADLVAPELAETDGLANAVDSSDAVIAEAIDSPAPAADAQIEAAPVEDALLTDAQVEAAIDSLAAEDPSIERSQDQPEDQPTV